MNLRSVCIAAAAGLAVYSASYADSEVVPVQDPHTEAATPIAGVRVHQEFMDVDVRDVTLGDVFAEIERQAPVRFEAADSVHERAVSEKFSDLSIVQGIQRLLIGQDYMIDHAPSQSGEESTGLIVRVLGESSRASRPAPAVPTPTDDPDQAAWQRADQLTELADDADVVTITAAVEQAIHDPHQTVREAALDVVEMMEDEEAPAQLVATVALHDSNPDLRTAALDVLDTLSDAHPEVALETFKQAVNDPDKDVQELAKDLVEALESKD
jgi:hypothetical protein